jgi:hypothetical protein
MSYINETISVNAYYFFSSLGKLKTFPKQIEHNQRHLTFKDGIQYLVQQGQHAIRMFDMTDGQTTYRLRLENNQWTLIGTY